MKLFVIGLDCADPELLLRDEQLPNLRRLMAGGCYGALESVVPPITVPAWRCMATSQDPGSLGVYGFRNRSNHSYDALSIVNSRSFGALTIWDYLAMEGKRSVLVGVPPSFPPPRVNGVVVGCFLTPSTAETYTHPPEVAAEIAALVGDYQVDVRDFRTHDKAALRDRLFEMSRRQFAVVRYLMQSVEWDYFQFVNIALDRVHHGFWRHSDPRHPAYKPGSPYADVIPSFYRHLDEEIGRLLELLDDDTAVLVVSDHGAQALQGGFCVNEWLVSEGLLVLEEYPETVTPFAQLRVDWSRTRAWSDGGYYARIFLNVLGREPRGVIKPSEYESFRDWLKRRLEATTGPDGALLGTRAYRPQDVYRHVRNVAPDLIVHFGGLDWRAVGGVGYRGVLHVAENDGGPDDCNHAQHGAYVLAAPNVPAYGEMLGTRLLDIAPTLMEVAGYDVPDTFQGHSIFGGMLRRIPAAGFTPSSGEEIVRERLQGLGYIA